ncbi:MAG: LamG-like jellyroll fold domain-containing protein [Cyclobacteriaceae bacterium]
MKKLLLLSAFVIINISETIAQCSDPTPNWVINEDFSGLSGTTPPDCWLPVGNPNSFNFDANRGSFSGYGEILGLPETQNENGVLTFQARNGTGRTYNGLTLDLGIYDGINFTKLFTVDYGKPAYQNYSYDFSSNTIQGIIAFRGGTSSISFLLDNVHYQSKCFTSTSATAITKDITVQLDATGNLILNPAEVDNGSVNSCEAPITNLSLDKSLFTCDDLGENTVTLTADDGFGNTSTATATVTVEPGFVFNSNQLGLDENGEANIDLDYHTSSKTDCDDVTYAFEQSTFTCDDAGYVLLTVIASYQGMTSTFTKTKTLSDYNNPVAIAQDIAVNIDETTGQAIVTPEMIDNGSSDNCGIASMTLSKTSFDCGDQGENEVTLTVTDIAGRTATATAIVTVGSFIEDVTLTSNTTTVCFDGANGSSATTIQTSGSTIGTQYYLRNNADNSIIDGPIDGTGSGLSFDAGAISENTIFNVYAEVPFSGKALDLSPSGAHLSVNTPGSFDYGSGYTISAWVKLGASGNSTFYNGIFYVGGTTGSDIEIYENSSGTITILHNRGNGGTQAAYSISGNTITNNSYVHFAATYNGLASRIFVNGVEVGAASLAAPTKTASSEMTFGYMNSSTFPAAQRYDGLMDDIRVYDKALNATEILADYDKCLSGTEDNLVLYFDLESASGSIYTDLVSSTPAQVKNGGTTTDEGAISCSFTCNRVMSETITIGDDVFPTAAAKNISLDYTGTMLEVASDDINNGSSDNCTSSENLVYSLSQSFFDCDDIGEQTITLYVTDEAGNTSSAEATVTVHSAVDDVTVTSSHESLCTGNTDNVTISVSGSFTGLNYSLRNSLDNSIVDGPIAGDGNTLEFDAGVVTETTTFNVFYANEVPLRYALNFDGQNEYINAGTSTRGVSNEVTVGAWIKAGYTSYNNIIVSKYDGSKGYILKVNSSGKAIFDGRTGNGVDFSSGQSATSVNDNEWHYIVGTASITTGEWKIYVDGVLESESVNAPGGTSLSPNSQALLIGAYYTSYFQGSIDEVAIWNTVLDEAAILGNSDACLGVASDNTVAYFDFEEGTGTTTTDKSTTETNGFMVNMEASDWISETSNSACGLCEMELSDDITITVGDNTPPVVITQDISVILDENGNATITPADIDNGSSDNCADASSLTQSLDITSFDINDLGQNIVTLTVTDANQNSATATAIVTVLDKQIQTATFTGVADKTFGDADFDITATVDSGLPVSFTVVSGGLSIVDNTQGRSASSSPTTFTITGAGTAVIRASNDGDATYAPLQEDITINVAKADQTITITPIADKVQAAAPFDVSASINTGLELSYAVSGPATISGTTVTLDGTLGSVTVTVSQQGTDNYNAASNSTSFEVIEKTAQTITFADLDDQTYGSPAQTLSATASSNLAVSYAVISGPVSINGNVMTITGVGEVTIEANQEGDDDFAAAPAVQKVFTIAKAPLQVTADSFTITYGEDVPTLTFTYSGFVNDETSANLDAEPTISANTDVIKGDLDAGTYDIILSGGSAPNYAFTLVNGTLTIVKTDQTVSIDDIDDKLTTDGPFNVAASTTSGLELSYEVTGPASMTGTTITLDGTPGTVTITATQAGSDNHNAASASVSFAVNAPLANERVEASVQVYPNPASSYLNIDATDFVQTKIYGLDGTLMLTTDKMNKIDIQRLPSGIYLIKIELKEKTLIQKLIIQN